MILGEKLNFILTMMLVYSAPLCKIMSECTMCTVQKETFTKSNAIVPKVKIKMSPTPKIYRYPVLTFIHVSEATRRPPLSLALALRSTQLNSCTGTTYYYKTYMNAHGTVHVLYSEYPPTHRKCRCFYHGVNVPCDLEQQYFVKNHQSYISIFFEQRNKGFGYKYTTRIVDSTSF